MGSTSRCAALAALAALALVGCSSDPAQDAVADAVDASKQVTAFCDAARANIEAAKPLAALRRRTP